MRKCLTTGAVAVLAVNLLGASPAIAQDSATTPAAEEALPNMAFTEKEVGDERKFWVVHKPGVTRAEAEADLAFCWRFVPLGVMRGTPDFVPWQRADATRKPDNRPGPYGLVGDVIGAMIAGPLDRSVRQSRMFRCMVPRGYARYRISEALWKDIYQSPPTRAIPLLARIAAGPQPPTPRVLP